MLNEGSARLYFLLRHSSRITRHTNAFAMRLPAAEGLFLRRKQSYLRPTPEDEAALRPGSHGDCAATAMRFTTEIDWA